MTLHDPEATTTRATSPFPRASRRRAARSCLAERARRLAAGLTLAATASGCVGYDEQPTTLTIVANELPRSVPGPLDWDAAWRFAFAHNPELAALAAEARAAGADVPALELQSQLQAERIAVMVDPLALLGLAQRGAEVALADAKAAEAVAALAAARWQTAAALAEVFAAWRALDSVPPVALELAVEPFVAAGLASPIGAAQVEGAVAGAHAERAAVAAERAMLGAELRRLLGLTHDADVELVPPPADWPPLPAANDDALLARPDLALAMARYDAADAAFRSAVAEQYPALMLGPELPLRGGSIDPMAVLRLPLTGAGPARAARDRRQAARDRVASALVDAINAVAVASRGDELARAREHASRLAAAAAHRALAAALAALASEVDAFEQLAERAPMAVRETAELREAALAAARARVRRAVASGWFRAEVRS